MPIYEYKCSQCNKVFEMLQSISAEPLTKCIYCQGSVTKLISAPAFQFKGSGFYVNDYKKANAKEDKNADTAAVVEGKNAQAN
jgi:putative FmdB family regulatory protein